MTDLAHDTARAEGTAEPEAPPARSARGLVGVLLAAAGLLGLGLRLWYLFHVPINSDEAIVGLMARGILHGHFVAFYSGQPYGGGEPYVVAVLFGLFGQSALTLELAPILLSVGAAVLTWRVARRLVAPPWLAALAGLLVWVGPDGTVANATREYGFRGVTMVCGLLCLLAALRMLDAAGTRWADAAVLGLAAGVGWWSSPEIVYFLIPAALLALGRLRTSRHHRVRDVLVGGGTFVVGALPWLWANVRSGGASLKASSFPGGAMTALNTGFGGRLRIFFRFSLPIQAGLRRLSTGLHLASGAFGVLLVVVVLGALALATLGTLARRDRTSAVAVGLLAFPFVFAAQPGTWFWNDGRYAVFLAPFLALVLVAALDAALRWRARHAPVVHHSQRLAMVMVAGVAAAGALSLATFSQDNAVSLGAVASGWTTPDGPVDQAIAVLEHHGVRDGFADYWVAYKLDLLDHGSMQFSTVTGDVDRSAGIEQAVEAARTQAWIFVPPAELQTGYTQFSVTPVIAGPGAVTESVFLRVLGHLGISYRTVDAGLLTAVIPSHPVTFQQVQAGALAKT